jgi:hypothetical protein
VDILSDNAVIQELDTVILVQDYPDQELVKEDMGAVVMVHDGGKAFEVEFITMTGDPLGVLNCECHGCRQHHRTIRGFSQGLKRRERKADCCVLWYAGYPE